MSTRNNPQRNKTQVQKDVVVQIDIGKDNRAQNKALRQKLTQLENKLFDIDGMRLAGFEVEEEHEDEHRYQ